MFLYWKYSSESGCCYILSSFLINSVSVTSCLCLMHRAAIQACASIHTLTKMSMWQTRLNAKWNA